MSAPLTIDERLLDYCTPRQREVLQAVIDTGSAREAARQLGVHFSYCSMVHKTVKLRAARQGYSPDASNMRAGAPEGFYVKRHSARFDKEGNPAGGWLISEPDKAHAEQMVRAMVEAIVEEARGTMAPVQAPAVADTDLLVAYPMGDPHFGMLAVAKEAGDDFDLKIAEANTKGAVDRLVSAAPPAETGLLIELGDFYHADDSKSRTPESGAILDADSRFWKVLQIGLRTMVYCARRMLEKHQRVIVWILPGNHDPHASLGLALALSAAFENEPRVTVEMDPSLYRYLRFGKVLLGAHHGHGAKANDLPAIMATDRPEDWGGTAYRYWHCGHVHHATLTEHRGCYVETHQTLAAKDAWHAGKGYRSGRGMWAVTYHAEFGEIGRTRCDIAMLEAA